MSMTKVGIIIGSSRKGSYSRKVANALKTMAPSSVEMKEVPIHELIIYNQDLDDEGTPPEAWVRFREEMKDLDAVLFVTPEYNRSVPPLLKNALDVGSRPYGASIWNGKPGAVVSVSTGGLGGFGANHHLRQSLVFLNVPLMQQPEAYLGNASALFDEEGRMINENTQAFLQKFVDAYVAWINLFANPTTSS